MNNFYRKYGSSKDMILPPPMPEGEETDVKIPTEFEKELSEIETPSLEDIEDRFYYYEEPKADSQKDIKTNPQGLKKRLEQDLLEEKNNSKSPDDILKMCTAFFKLAIK